jgi:MFS family permease
MAGIFGLCNNAGGVVNLLLIDRAGRKILFLSGLTILSICLAIFAVFSAKYEQTNDPGESCYGQQSVQNTKGYTNQVGAKLESG